MTPTLTFECLKEDIMIIILGFMDMSDVLRVRSTCKSLYKVTKDKLLWIYILRHLVVDHDVPLPPYCKSIELLDASQIEAIAVRAARLTYAWDSGRLVPQSFSRMDISRSVTLLRLVCARWLFVASSDTICSSFACYEIAGALSDNRRPVAECFLSGPVHTAEIEVQNGDLVIALAIKARSPFMEIISLRYQDNRLVFVRLASLPGLSHIRHLRGDFIGCAMRNNVSIPHLINWRTKAAYALAESPDENGCCLAISFWLDYIVVARPNDVQIFTASTAHPTPRLLQTIPFGRYAWDVFIIDKSGRVASMEGLFPPVPPMETGGTLEFLVTSEDNAYLYSLSVEKFTMSVYRQSFERHEWPLRVRIGSSGLRMTWISGQHGVDSDESPVLLSSRLYRPTIPAGQGSSDERFIGKEIEIAGSSSEFPGLWALTTFDVDESMGLIALGNVFGELILCDYGGTSLGYLGSITDNFAEWEAPGLHVISQHPVEMNVPPVAYFWLDGGAFNDEQEIVLAQHTSDWYRIPDADIPSGWSNDWENWWKRWAWQGLPQPGDLSWRLEHSLRFLGQPEPLLYTREVTFLRAGGLYFFWNFEDELFVIDNKLSLDAILENLRGDGQLIASPGKDRSETGQNEVIQFHHIWDSEKENGRNRWMELQERGGKPHPFLLSEAVNDMEDDDDDADSVEAQ